MNQDIKQKDKLALLFPGIGYTCDKPLLYYSARLAKEYGYTVRPVPYGNFPPNVKGDPQKMEEVFCSALEQTEELLGDISWDTFSRILLIGKSIGTAVGCCYAQKHGLFVQSILLTPLEETFPYVGEKAIAFHGTADPWARTSAILEACQKKNIPVYLTQGANHSLETGDVDQDLNILLTTINRIQKFIS